MDLLHMLSLVGSANKFQLQLEADSKLAQITHLGWDTEGTGRSNVNLIQYPTELAFYQDANELFPDISGEMASSELMKFSFEFPRKKVLNWEISFGETCLRMQFSTQEDLSAILHDVELTIPFDPGAAVISVISNTWNDQGNFFPPFILSAPDLGQLLVNSASGSITGKIEGLRRERWLATIFEFPVPAPRSPVMMDFTPVDLPCPEGFKDTHSWNAARRGWFNLLQFSSGASGGSQNVIGVWANNTLSDPVSSVLYMLGDATLLVPDLAPGVSMPPLLRRAVDYWLDYKTNPDGLVAYTARGKNQQVMDSNPAVLIAAWCYYKVTRDRAWLEKRIDQLEFISRYMEGRDIDGDGLIESIQSGNRGIGGPFDPDCAWDCYRSGHKNAYVNALVYRAWNGLAQLEDQLNRESRANHYRDLARRLKENYCKTFYNASSGWLGFWRSEDGELHDINNDSPTSIAISYGLIDVERGREMLQKYWNALKTTGFDRFDLGIPLNFVPVPESEMLVYFPFQQFLNGGCAVSNASWFMNALYVVGMDVEADIILNAMLERQSEGVFENGGGFQNGFVDKMGDGAEVFDWSGQPAGYEGHLVYCWGFLQSLLLKDPTIRHSMYQEIKGGR
ncbi:MAG: hypothetical protein ACFFCS_00990 [Candidatus Hodarchaeota archaeon]